MLEDDRLLKTRVRHEGLGARVVSKILNSVLCVGFIEAISQQKPLKEIKAWATCMRGGKAF